MNLPDPTAIGPTATSSATQMLETSQLARRSSTDGPVAGAPCGSSVAEKASLPMSKSSAAQDTGSGVEGTGGNNESPEGVAENAARELAMLPQSVQSAMLGNILSLRIIGIDNACV